MEKISKFTPLLVDRAHHRIWQNPDITNLVNLDEAGDDRNTFRVWIMSQDKEYAFTVICKDPFLEEFYSARNWGSKPAKKLGRYLDNKVIGFLESQDWCSSGDRKIWNENQYRIEWTCDCIVCKGKDGYTWES
jgi:23S rRNA A1618 N6-methylase RlmF